MTTTDPTMLGQAQSGAWVERCSCGAIAAEGVKKCPACLRRSAGIKVRASDKASNGVAVQLLDGTMKYCPGCRAPILRHKRACRTCLKRAMRKINFCLHQTGNTGRLNVKQTGSWPQHAKARSKTRVMDPEIRGPQAQVIPEAGGYQHTAQP